MAPHYFSFRTPLSPSWPVCLHPVDYSRIRKDSHSLSCTHGHHCSIHGSGKISDVSASALRLFIQIGLLRLSTYFLQWLKKLVHIWKKFPCKVNCGPENKAKLVGIFDNKAKYHVFVWTKYQNISLTHWFNTRFTMATGRWTSFCACMQDCLLWPLSLPLSLWACSQLGFYKPPYVFSLLHLHLPPVPMHTSSRDPIYVDMVLEALWQISNRWGQVGCAEYIKTLTLLCWHQFEALWSVYLGWFSCWKLGIAANTTLARNSSW